MGPIRNVANSLQYYQTEDFIYYHRDALYLITFLAVRRYFLENISLCNTNELIRDYSLNNYSVNQLLMIIRDFERFLRKSSVESILRYGSVRSSRRDVTSHSVSNEKTKEHLCVDAILHRDETYRGGHIRYTTQFNSSHFTRLEINPCSTAIQSKTTPRKRESGERVGETIR